MEKNEIIDEHHEEHFEEEPSKWKKVFTLIIAGFLIILMVSYVGISYGLDDIIVSLISSEKLENNI